MDIGKEPMIPPGQHPKDPPNAEIDPVGFALERLQTFLIWCETHRSSYELYRNTNPRDAANEMNCLQDAIEQAILHMRRLTELVLGGVQIDSNKKLPKSLNCEIWNRAIVDIKQLRAERCRRAESNQDTAE